VVISLLLSLELIYDYLPVEERDDYQSVLSISIQGNENLSQFMSNLTRRLKLPVTLPTLIVLHQLVKIW